MLLIIQHLKNYLISFVLSLPNLIGQSRKKLDYPVKPDNDKHWNKVRYEFLQFQFLTSYFQLTIL